MIKTICDNCGKTFLKRKRSFKVTKHNYCCKECFYTSCRKENVIHDRGDYSEIEIHSNKHGLFLVKIDTEDLNKVSSYKWTVSLHKGGVFYIVGRDRASKTNIQLHRIITDCPKGLTVDHINHDTLDNRKQNLKVCTQAENNLNKDMHPLNTSGYKNISIDKKIGKFRVTISRNRRWMQIGAYKTIEEAIKARDDYLLKLNNI